MNSKVPIPKDEITEFCRRHHIRRLSLFGSVLTGDFRPDSDVDVLVEFEEGHTPGLVFFFPEIRGPSNRETRQDNRNFSIVQ